MSGIFCPNCETEMQLVGTLRRTGFECISGVRSVYSDRLYRECANCGYCEEHTENDGLGKSNFDSD